MALKFNPFTGIFDQTGSGTSILDSRYLKLTGGTVTGSTIFSGGLVANSAISGSGTINLTGTGSNTLAGGLTIGSNTSASTTQMDVVFAQTNPGANRQALRILQTMTITANDGSQYVGQNNVVTVIPSSGVSQTNGVGTRSVSGSVVNGGAGTLDSAIVYWGRFGGDAGGVITNAAFIRAASPSLTNGSTIGSLYGLFIEQQKASAVTAGWGIYQESSLDNNYFRGNVGIGIGTSTPLSTLHISSATGSVFTQGRNDTSIVANDIISKRVVIGNDTQQTSSTTFFEEEIQSVSSITTNIAPGKWIIRLGDSTVGGSPIEQFNLVNGLLTVKDNFNLAFGSTTGTKLGTSTSDKLAFWNTTPVAQQVLATGAGATVDNVISLLQTLGLCRQS